MSGTDMKYDMPYLEFNQYFKTLNEGTNVFAPHEMQWSMDQFMERMIDEHDEEEGRLEKRMEDKYD